MSKKNVNPVERMIVTKKKLITRLQGDIKDVRARAEEEVQRIEFRIRQATTLLNALQNGKRTYYQCCTSCGATRPYDGPLE